MMRLPFLTLFLTLWLTAWAGALEITSGPEVDLEGTTAVIRWTTDTECGTVLKYGTDPHHLNHRAEGAVGVKHEVTLQNLADGRLYHFSAGTSKRSLRTGQFGTGKVGGPRSPPSPRAAKAAPEKKPAPASKPAPDRKAPAAAPAGKAPPARMTWGDFSSLQDHFARHGRDFGSTSAAHYAQQAWEFLQRAMDDGLPAKVDGQGVIRVYEARTQSFAAYNRNGTTRTFFKPQRPDYFHDQPGKPVRLSRPARP